MEEIVEELKEETMEEVSEVVEEAPKKEDFSNYFLDPDHPMLEPFQKALREHLQKQIAAIKEDLFGIDIETRKKEQEIEDVGLQAYEIQQQVCYQQRTLETLVEQIEKVTVEQEKEEESLKKNTKLMKNVQNDLFRAEKTNRDLTNEIEGITGLIRQLSESGEEMESQITISKRILDKSRQENDQLAKQKRKQDFLIHRIMTDIWNIENEIETNKLQIIVKEEELDDLEHRAAVGNTNIIALETELKALMSSFTSVVAAVSNRDKGLECLNQELSSREERHKDILTEIGQSKKLIKREQMENQKFTALKERVLEDIKMSKSQIDEQTTERKLVEKELRDVKTYITQMKKDIKASQCESHLKTLAYNKLQLDYKRLAEKKNKIDQEIFTCIQSEVENHAYTKKAQKALNELADKKRDVEVIQNEAENKRSSLYSEIESQKFKIEELTRIYNETKEEMAKLDEVAKKMTAELEKFVLLYRKKEKHVLTLNEKLEQKIASNHDDRIAKAEMKIIDLTKLIEETQQEIKNLQMFWMREQKNILAMAKERQEQIHSISVLRKQMLILDQKNLRLSDEFDQLKKQEELTQHRINSLTNKATILCDRVYNKKNHKNDLDKNNLLMQDEFEVKLKEAELELLRIEASITEIEEDKVNLSKELIETNREGLEWEKKFHMTKEFVHKNKNSEDVSNMRQELHKMEVMYAQMKKNQEKLLRSLQGTLVKRDSLFFYSDVKQKTQKKNDYSIRSNFQKKLDNLRNQIKQAKTETRSNKNKYKYICDEIVETEKKIDEILTEPVFDKDYKGALRHKLEDVKSNRQLKFEMLLFQQRKSQLHSLIIQNRTPYTVYRKDDELTLEYHKAKEMNAKLSRIVKELIKASGGYDPDLHRLDNTLELINLCT
ncbi:unnamed protein product [Phyllotreta striolata]|uniref:Coiled-coil domain-containing protein 40 n=1 Tax=Phyllotreta striolata TaxID=444603 RepID=A0A9N9TSV3_PHYSR|nr:unnamed protein product [Phyllotreta striolata]